AKKKPFEVITLSDLGIDAEDQSVARSIMVTVAEKPPREAGEKVVDEGNGGVELAEYLTKNRLAEGESSCQISPRTPFSSSSPPMPKASWRSRPPNCSAARLRSVRPSRSCSPLPAVPMPRVRLPPSSVPQRP